MTYEMPKGVKFLELNFNKVTELWDRIKGINGLYDDFSRDNFKLFQAKLVDPSTVWLECKEGFGVLYLTNVIKGLSATGHILYWDKKLRGREDFTLEILKWLMDVVPLIKVNLYLPDYARGARLFAERLSFHKEGKIRRWSFNNGKPFDICVYGITYEEVRDGVILRTRIAERGRLAENGIRGHGTTVSSESPRETSTGHSDKSTSSKSDATVDRTGGAVDGTVLRGPTPTRGNAGHVGIKPGPVQDVNGGPNSEHNLTGKPSGDGANEGTGKGDDKGSTGVRSGDSKGSSKK